MSVPWKHSACVVVLEDSDRAGLIQIVHSSRQVSGRDREGQCLQTVAGTQSCREKHQDKLMERQTGEVTPERPTVQVLLASSCVEPTCVSTCAT